MQHKSLIVLGLFLSSLFLAPLSAFAQPKTVDQYSYEMDISFSQPLTRSETVILDLPEDVLARVDHKLSNLLILDENNNEVKFKASVDMSLGKEKNVSAVEVSSQKEGSLSDLVDDDPFTIFKFDERIDQRDPSWVTLDLGEPTPVARVSAFTETRPAVRFVEILGGLEKDNLSRIVSKRDLTRPEVDISTTSPLQFLQVRMWGVGVKVSDIKVYTGVHGQVSFEAEPDARYRFVYGGNPKYYSFSDRVDESLGESMDSVFFGNETFSRFLGEDADEDGVLNEEDNCPFVPNKSQKDVDEDRIGDLCDNAVEKRNSSQTDVDKDGVGDVIDNCKLVPNEKQKDKDGDGIGDECDTVNDPSAADLDAKKRDIADKTKKVSVGWWVNMILIFVVIGGIIYVYHVKKKK